MKQQKRQSSAEVPVPGDLVWTEAVKGRLQQINPHKTKGFLYGLGLYALKMGYSTTNLVRYYNYAYFTRICV